MRTLHNTQPGAACTANAMHTTNTSNNNTQETGPLARLPLPAIVRHTRKLRARGPED